MSARVVHQVAAWCLGYPDDALRQRLPLFGRAVGELPVGTARTGLLAFLACAQDTALAALQRDYVELFDLSAKRSLYLSYWTDGDTRRRGEALAAIKRRYRAAGWTMNPGGELPDHLPMVLEYAAIADPVDGPRLLQSYRPSLELIRFALRDVSTPYAGLLDAVCSTLPGPSPTDRAAVHRMAGAGPPVELVGTAEPIGIGYPGGPR